jgi:hypothetical protein
MYLKRSTFSHAKAQSQNFATGLGFQVQSYFHLLSPSLSTNPSYDEQVANILLSALFSALVIVRAYTLLTLIHILL